MVTLIEIIQDIIFDKTHPEYENYRTIIYNFVADEYEKLTQKQKYVMYEREINRKTYREIGDYLSLPRNGVERIRFGVLVKMRNRAGKRGFGDLLRKQAYEQTILASQT